MLSDYRPLKQAKMSSPAPAADISLANLVVAPAIALVALSPLETARNARDHAIMCLVVGERGVQRLEMKCKSLTFWLCIVSTALAASIIYDAVRWLE